jgi:hypothetical protein
MADEPQTSRIYRLKVTLKDIRPPIWRRLDVPGDITLPTLHRVLQVAFDWQDYHLHQFLVGKTCYGVPHPDYDWGPPMLDEAKVRLQDVAKRARAKLVYEYDFGDGWQHEIAAEKIMDPEPNVIYPRCLAGKRAAPPEDSGGPWGYAHKLQVLADPDDPDHDEFSEWLGEDFDPEALDIDRINGRLNAVFRPRRVKRSPSP